MKAHVFCFFSLTFLTPFNNICTSSLLESEHKRLLIFGPSAKINEILASVQCIKQFLLDHTNCLEQQDSAQINQKLDTIVDHLQKQTLTLQQHDQNMVHIYKNLIDRLKILMHTIETVHGDTHTITAQLNAIMQLAQSLSAASDHLLTDLHATWTTLGTVESVSENPDLLTNNEAIDAADLNVIQWLKTIYRKINQL